MARNVYLVGELAEKFGGKFSIAGDSYQDALKCIDVNRPGFRKYILECMDNDIAFTFETESGNKKAETEQDLIMPLEEGDIIIATVPAGSKSGFAKIFAAVVLFAVVGPWMAGKAAAAGASAAGGAAAAGGTAAAGGAAAAQGTFLGMKAATITNAVNSMALNLALTGIQQIMAPDPSVDNDEPTNYLFSGDSQNILEGDPIPVLYGELKVPGMPISTTQYTGRQKRLHKMTVDKNNNITPSFISTQGGKK